MDSNEIREKFIKFFEEKGHKKMSPSSLIPAESDSSVLFTTAGMQQFKRFYLNSEEASDKNVITIQPCVRTSDIEEVGDTTHLTFFEMLGNFSFGGYFKKETIEMAWEFLTDPEWMGIEKNRISATYFDHDKARAGIAITVDTDKESFNILKELKVKGLNKIEGAGEDNFWSLGTIGSPGGPTVEFYVDNVEIWNLVFNEYIWHGTHWEDIPTKGVDTGMGLERLAAVLQDKKDIFETDLFLPIIGKIEEISGKKYQENKKAFRIIADHVRGAIFIIADKHDIFPSKKGRGSVLRRLIRETQDNIIDLNFKKPLFIDYVFQFQIDYFEKNCSQEYCNNLRKKTGSFHKILSEELGLLEMGKERFEAKIYKRERILKRFSEGNLDLQENADPKWLKPAFIDKDKDSISIAAGKFAYNLWNENRCSKNFFLQSLDHKLREKIDREEFEKGYKEGEEKFKEISRAGIGMFKGGLVDASEQTTKLHTAAHLLLAALRQVLGSDIKQAGSNINQERLRFDFTYPEKVSDDKLKQIEDLVNQKIGENLPVKMQEMSLEEAKSSGATGVFDERYGDKVKVYSITPSTRDARSGSREDYFSREICGGPHVENTGSLVYFKITKEESSSAGVRRIKAVLNP